MKKLQTISYKSKLAHTTALGLACMMGISACPIHAADVINNGVYPTYDEAYYATMDYYGNYSEGSIVKSYNLNGATEIKDYGTYDEVKNLSDGSEPVSENGEIKFSYDKDNAPKHLYFEGKTQKPFTEMPYKIAMSYELNGVPTQAEELVNKSGVVTIHIDVTPNDNASQYAKNNYILTAATMFNQDDILSLKADGAQTQLVGNIRAALYIVLPGEEKHYTIEVGTEKFSFSGVTYLMVPATLEQLDQVAEISKRKDDLEDDYKKLNGSFDKTLDALNNITGSLNSTANGLDQLNDGREQISSGKGLIYDDIDLSKMDIGLLAELLKPFNKELETTSETITKAGDSVRAITDIVLSLKKEITDTRKTLARLQNHAKDTTVLSENLENMQSTLDDLKVSIDNANSPISVSQSANMTDSLATVKKLNTAYQGGSSMGSDDESKFIASLALAGGTPASDVSGLLSVWNAAKAAGGSLPEGHPYYATFMKAKPLAGLYQYVGSTNSFENFCKAVLKSQGKDESLASSMNQLNDASSGSASDQAQLELLLSTMDKTMGGLGGTASQINSSINSIADPTSKLVDQLSNLTNNATTLKSLLNDTSDLAGTGVDVTLKIEESLLDLKDLEETLNAYEPVVKQALSDIQNLNTKVSDSLVNAQKLTDDVENLARSSGETLDKGTMDTLNGLSDSLRKIGSALDTNKDIRNSKDSLDKIITDTWNEHTGDVDNLLSMDSTADIESLTSDKNANPESIQLLIRSQEIKEDDEKTSNDVDENKEKIGFFKRVANMFKDLWKGFIGIFTKKQ